MASIALCLSFGKGLYFSTHTPNARPRLIGSRIYHSLPIISHDIRSVQQQPYRVAPYQIYLTSLCAFNLSNYSNILRSTTGMSVRDASPLLTQAAPYCTVPAVVGHFVSPTGQAPPFPGTARMGRRGAAAIPRTRGCIQKTNWNMTGKGFRFHGGS